MQMTEMAEAGKSDLLELTNEQLNHYTAGFSEENFLGQTMFGMLFRGKIINVPEVEQTKEVIVKIWKNQKSLYIDGIDKCSRLKVCFLISCCCPFSLCSPFFSSFLCISHFSVIGKIHFLDVGRSTCLAAAKNEESSQFGEFDRV